jgi:hypothetical protein
MTNSNSLILDNQKIFVKVVDSNKNRYLFDRGNQNKGH